MEKNTSQVIQDEKRIKKKRRKRKAIVKQEVFKPNVVKVAHDKCDDARLDYVLFPIGFKYNEELQSLRKGDIIKFLDKSEHWVVDVVRLQVRSAIADAICLARYGFGIKRAMEVWKERARMQNMDDRVVSDSECLVVFYYKKEVEYEYV